MDKIFSALNVASITIKSFNNFWLMMKVFLAFSNNHEGYFSNLNLNKNSIMKHTSSRSTKRKNGCYFKLIFLKNL